MENTHTLEMFDLKGRIATITGGAGLLGIKHAETILEANGKVILLDINKESLDKTVGDLHDKYPNKVWGFVLDITNEEKVETFTQTATEKIGELDILINNAANNPHVKKGETGLTRLENFPLKVWENDLSVGLTGAYLMSKHLGSKMAERGRGVIINIASDLGIIAPDQRLYKQKGLKEEDQPTKPVTYSVVKHGLIGLTKYLATYWAEKGVRVNTLTPASVYNNQPTNFVEKIEKLIPLGRMSDKKEFKGALLLLCSDASTYMTGANVIVDGGRTSW